MSLQQLYGLLLIYGLLCVGDFASTKDKKECAMEDHAKEDCGYPGISSTECGSRGCCWNTTSTHGVPWCYLSTAAYQCTSCDVCPDTAKRECGNYETTQKECEANGCLWCPLHEQSGPWCVVNTGLQPSKECQKKDKDKVECGYFGISGEECQNLTCCWHPTIEEEVPWCYNSPTSDKCTSCDACPPPARAECGNYETTQEDCVDNKCLWCPKNELGSWCLIDTGLPLPPGCKAEYYKKKECGWPGINAHECENRSCCWQPTSFDGVPWCFLKAEALECTSCTSCPATARRDCGSYETTQKECEANKCLWCPLHNEEGPWCVVNTGLVTSKECTIKDEDKEDCAEFGTNSEECGRRGCCWHPTTAYDVPWCYYKKGQ